MKRTMIGAWSVVPLVVGALSLGSGAASATAAAADSGGEGVYIVQLVEAPAASYDGTVAGLAATKPAKGTRLDATAPTVAAYASYLSGRQAAVLRTVGNPAKLYGYSYSFNGFAAKLSGKQAANLAKDPAVLAVSKAQTYTVDTSSTPSMLGLDAPGGLWEQLGGTTKAGEDVVIGIVDSGIWPESLSFADRIAADGLTPALHGELVYNPMETWKAKCRPGEAFVPTNCNKKLLSAQYFNAGQGGDAGINRDRPWEFNSPRDYNGHGTHTAATAGGNYATPVTGDAAALGATVSGMAPRARIAAYKALWSTESGDTASGSGADLVAAIDKAVADGVDVINYSVSGNSTQFLDPVELAFLSAADAGVFVSASAGNSGPATSTVAHPSPWITTVAAGTHNRDSQGSVTLGDGTTYAGASLARASLTAPLIDSSAAGLAGADPAQVALCYGNADGAAVLDPAKVAGKIVVCDRGVSARTNKSLAVKEAGGVGMILVNTSVNSINADFHAVPTVHLQVDARAAVKASAATAGATARINPSTLTYTTPAPFTASFSSRGPLLAGGGDLLKPDVIAPGQDILAAVSPMTAHGASFNLLSGTSMSAPHVAGLAALLRDRHPDWSPMAIKSALMTSASDVLDGPNTNPLVIFRQGAGHVRPNSAADPGLVYDSSWNDWLAFLCGATTGVRPSSCAALSAAGYSLDPSDFNGASIAIGDLAGAQSVTRKVTNVSGATAVFTSSVVGLPGITTQVTPSTLTLGAGETGSFVVTFNRTDAAIAAYVGGQLTWSGGGYAVRSPIVLRPVALAAPAAITAGANASTSFPVRFGYTGDFAVAPRGLVPSQVTDVTLDDDPSDSFAPVESASTTAITVTVPAGTTYLRLATYDQPGSTDDVDLYLYSGTTLVALSGNGGSTEEINRLNPAPGTYTLYVHGYSVANPATTVQVHNWTLGSADAGNFTVSSNPAAATTAGSGTVTVTVGTLTSGRWLGSIVYSGSTGMPNPTIVRVDVP